MKTIAGIGVILQTSKNTYLFQERDKYAPTRPEKIAPFGGGLEEKEDVLICALREMREELDLILSPNDLISIGIFESESRKNTFFHMYLVKNIDKSKLMLNEGKSIVELSKEQALEHNNVTDFTKRVLNSL